MTSKPVTRADLADALSCFWNAALGAQQQDQTPVSCIVEGIQAVAWRLEEIDKADRETVAQEKTTC